MNTAQPDHTWLAIAAGVYSFVLLVVVPLVAHVLGRTER